jgi:hypothetical protein
MARSFVARGLATNSGQLRLSTSERVITAPPASSRKINQ